MSGKHTINIKGEMLDISSPKVMGIINITPDSFFEASRATTTKNILSQAEKMLKEGATFLDIGGYSSRPGASDIPMSVEMDRVIGPIRDVVSRFPEAFISIDTFRSRVAQEAVEAGASMVNDISAGHLDEMMLDTVAKLGVPYIAMHMRGAPQTMNEMTIYDDLLLEMMKYFSDVLHDCNQKGIKDVLIDPGFGFAKTADQGFDLLKKLDHFHHLNRPILVGVSRKSMIYRTLNLTAEEALNGTSVANTVALLKGAQILRVHDVREAIEAIELVNRLK